MFKDGMIDGVREKVNSVQFGGEEAGGGTAIVISGQWSVVSG
jgi:hypothetical protein